MVSDSSTFNYTSIALKDVFSLNFFFSYYPSRLGSYMAFHV